MQNGTYFYSFVGISRGTLYRYTIIIKTTETSSAIKLSFKTSVSSLLIYFSFFLSFLANLKTGIKILLKFSCSNKFDYETGKVN